MEKWHSLINNFGSITEVYICTIDKQMDTTAEIQGAKDPTSMV